MTNIFFHTLKFLSPLVFIASLPLPTEGGILGELPDVIVCQIKNNDYSSSGSIVFYIDAREQEGRGYYKSLGRPSGNITVNAEGVIEAPAVESCEGRNITELRDQKRAFDLKN